MNAIISVLLTILFLKIFFRVLPVIIGFTFTVIVGILQICLVLFLVPIIGLLFFGVEGLIVLLLIGLIRRV